LDEPVANLLVRRLTLATGETLAKAPHSVAERGGVKLHRALPAERSGSRFKDQLPRALDTRFEIGIAHRARFDEIDRATKESLERLFEAKIRFKRKRVGMPAIEFDQKVNVAVFGVEITAPPIRKDWRRPPNMVKHVPKWLESGTIRMDDARRLWAAGIFP
jgi:hypothetical protein